MRKLFTSIHIGRYETAEEKTKPLSSDAVLGEVLALETEDFHTEEDWIRKEDVLNILGKYFA